MLARLGLRAGEVANLELDDIDWAAGELVIRGKGNRVDRMPLLQEVGKAVADYLKKGRPRCSTRRVFVHCKAPYAGFSSPPNAVSGIVNRALARRAESTKSRRTSAAPFVGYEPPAERSFPDPNRSGAAASANADHGDLRKSGCERATRAGSAVAGRGTVNHCLRLQPLRGLKNSTKMAGGNGTGTVHTGVLAGIVGRPPQSTAGIGAPRPRVGFIFQLRSDKAARQSQDYQRRFQTWMSHHV